MSESTSLARVCLHRSETLANAIEATIRDVLISEAGNIDGFHERREDLLTIDHRALFFYAASLVVGLTARAENWPEEKVARTIDSMADLLAHALAFQNASPIDMAAAASELATQLGGSVANLIRNLDRLEDIMRGGEGAGENAVFTLILMYLRQVHPGSLTLFSLGQPDVLSSLLRRFWDVSMSAAVAP